MICSGNAVYLLLKLKSKRKQKFSQDLLYNKKSLRSINHLRAVYEGGSRYTMSRETIDFKNINLSANRVVENVEDLTGNIESQLKEKLKNFRSVFSCI